MKAVSVSAELLVLQRSVQGVADILDVQKVDNPVSDDAQRQVVALLSLVAVRLRDLGRVARGRMPVELFWAPHNQADAMEDLEDLVLRDRAVTPGKNRK
jgi:hypothetical protein